MTLMTNLLGSLGKPPSLRGIKGWMSLGNPVVPELSVKRDWRV